MPKRDARKAAEARVMRAAMRRCIPLLEYDAASYDLSARYATYASTKRTFKAKERERREMIRLLTRLTRKSPS